MVYHGSEQLGPRFLTRRRKLSDAREGANMEGKKEGPERSGKTQLEEIREMLGKCLQQQSTLLQRQAEDRQTAEQILL
jgi:hypothetical protein